MTENKKTITLFGSKPKQPPAPTTPPPNSGKALRAIKILEERISNLDKKAELIENNILSVNKRQNVEIKTVHLKMLEMERDITNIKRKIVEIAADLKNFARTEDIETVKKYLDLWQPLNFVTRQEIEEIIDEKLRQ